MTTVPDRPQNFVGGNLYDKYRTSNPLYRRLMGGFLSSATDLLGKVRADRVLEVGSGPGDLANQLHLRLPWLRDASYLGLDVSLEDVASSSTTDLGSRFLGASVYRLPFAAETFDCVVACEVFEHLEHPAAALDEVARVASDMLLLSVPWEPMWRLLNMARGKYLRHLGNTPGHLQNYSRQAIRQLLSKRFELIDERYPFPWTMLLARKRDG